MTNGVPGGHTPSEWQLTPARLWQLVLRRRLLVAGIAALVVGLAALYVMRQQPLYRSVASLRVEESRSGRSILAAVAPAGGGGRGTIATDVLELQSYRMAAEVVDSLSLHVRVATPERPRSQVLGQVNAPADAQPGLYLLERRADGSYSVRAEPRDGNRTGARHEPLPARVEIGRLFRIGQVELALAPGLRRDPPEQIRIAVVRFHDAVAEVQAGLDVSQPLPEAQLVMLEYVSTDPRLAADVPNVLADRFIRYKTMLGRAEGRSKAEFLRDQVANYAQELTAAENALREFRERSRVVAPEEQADEEVRRYAELRAQRDQLASERENLARLLARADAGASERSGSAYRQLIAFPTFLTNPAVQDILRSLNGLDDQRTQMLQRRTESNEDVQLISVRIGELEGQLHRLAVNYLANLDSQLAALDGSLARFAGALSEIPAREIEYARLVRQAKMSEEIYTLLQTRLKESEIEEAVAVGNVRVVDVAQVPRGPFAPQPMRMMMVAMILGLLLGAGAAVARDAMDTRIHTRAEAQAVTGGLPILGFIPPLRVASDRPGRLRRNGKSAPDVAALAQRLVARYAPQSPESEAYRSLRTSITFADVERPPHVLVVTSATPGEGKSTSAANLAITMARQGTRTLLVDADLRKGLLHHLFGVAQEPGLTHVLVGRAALEEAVHPVTLNGEGEPSLYVLATGAFPPNPAEMLGSSRMHALVEQMRSRFDLVIFDAPPVNLVTDAAVLGTMVDGTLLVARAGTTDREALHHAAGQLQHLRARVIGLILNDFDVATAGYYGYVEGSQ